MVNFNFMVGILYSAEISFDHVLFITNSEFFIIFNMKLS